MFGLSTLLRTTTSTVASTINSTGTVINGGLALIEEAVLNRTSVEAVQARKDAYTSTLRQEQVELAKSMGETIDELHDNNDNFIAKMRERANR